MTPETQKAPKMKIHKKCLIENAASEDATRSAIAEPFLDITNNRGTLIATNGRILAQIPVEVDDADVAGYVSEAVLKSARKQAGKLDTALVSANGVARLADGSTMPRHGGANAADRFPNWRQVVPQNPAAIMILQLDAKLLWQLAQAMGTEGVRLVIEGARKPVTVEPCGAGRHGEFKPVCDGARGVIMPIAPAEKCHAETGLPMPADSAKGGAM